MCNDSRWKSIFAYLVAPVAIGTFAFGTTAAILSLTQSNHVTIINNAREPQTPPAEADQPGKAEPPAFVAGLPEDWLKRGRAAEAAFPQPFRVALDAERQAYRSESAYLWPAVLELETPRKPRGQHYDCGPQQTGDCVSWGWATAIIHTGANAVRAGTIGGLDDPFPPFMYGASRVTIGGGRPSCRRLGAYPDDCAAAYKKLGWLTYGEAARSYSGGLADQLGCDGPPEVWLKQAAARAGGDCHPIRTLDELLEALHNGYAGTAGIPWSPGRERTDRGRLVTQFNGADQGGHQIAFIGWDAERRHVIFGNSHGPNRHGRNEGDPPGSFRVTVETVEWMLENGTFWAFSTVEGFPAQELDLSPLLPKPRRAESPAKLNSRAQARPTQGSQL